MRAELLGVRLTGSGLLSHVEVPLSPGLTVLAGVNGAGKSQVLQGVRSALAGGDWPGGYAILFRIVDGDSAVVELEQSVLTLLRGKLPVEDRGTDSQRDFDWRGTLRASLSYEGEDTTFPFAALGDALLREAFFALRRDGLWLAASPRSEDLAVRQAFQALGNHWNDVLDQVGMWPPGTEGEVYFDASPFEEDEQAIWVEDSSLPPASPYAGDRLPVPLVHLGRVKVWPLSVQDLDGTSDVTDASRQLIANSLQEPDDVLYLMEGRATPAAEVARRRWREGDGLRAVLKTPVPDPDWAEQAARFETPESGPLAEAGVLSELATHWYRRLFPSAQSLACRVAPVLEWVKSAPVWWSAEDGPSGVEVRIDRLSAAQRRWAVFAITLALRARHAVGLRWPVEANPLADWLVVDEPEAGVHRAAERQLARALASISAEEGVGVLAATHSPEMIGAAHHALVVSRDRRGSIIVQPMQQGLPGAADDLGVPVTDLLGWYKQFLLVEGAHDEAVVRAALEDVLVETRTLVLPLRGVKGTSAAVDSRLLTTFTEARLVLLVDGLGAQAVEAWTAVQQTAATDVRGARRLLNESFDGGGWESAFLRDAGEVLLGRGRIGDVSVVALSVGDIIELLPAGDFVPGATDWAPLRAEYAAEVSAARRERRQARDFKTWLRETRSATVGSRKVKQAAERLDAIPDDLLRLAHVLAEGSGGWDA